MKKKKKTIKIPYPQTTPGSWAEFIVKRELERINDPIKFPIEEEEKGRRQDTGI